MNKRRHERIEVHNVVANLSNGVEFFSGTVSDVSRAGILLDDIPKELRNLEERLTIIVSANDKDYKMMVVPKWISKDYSEKRMGLGILDAPLDWTLFVMNCEPADENVWAATTHLPDC
ncbi:MAG: PilZ domain-containing protein [Desulfobulbaceae bacterium]|nr:PilZ domain-containing protein [Desulfobulbaceae bacterium]